MKRFLVVWIIFISAPLSQESSQTRFIVWNVGQGLWTTWISAEECLHFDAGGERWPLRELSRECRTKKNFLFLSHWDLDHVGGVGKLRTLLPNLCLAASPGGTTKSPRKKKLLSGLAECATPSSVSTRELIFSSRGKDPNSVSRIWILEGKILLPGDSPMAAEKLWLRKIPQQNRMEILLLGHHGSQTSTSDDLLSHLPFLRVAIASARKKKYGHPHAVVISRLLKRKIPILRTEEWGHLAFQKP